MTKEQINRLRELFKNMVEVQFSLELSDDDKEYYEEMKKEVKAMLDEEQFAEFMLDVYREGKKRCRDI